jgi:hypothetical protein
MTPWLIIFVGLIYAYIGVENFVKGNYSVAIIFIGYAFSNGGLYLATKG